MQEVLLRAVATQLIGCRNPWQSGESVGPFRAWDWFPARLRCLEGDLRIRASKFAQPTVYVPCILLRLQRSFATPFDRMAAALE